ncbi:MAG: hypothetical protein H7X86_02315 [Gorillibacterium sp.]|nr:hypothetical protein [Gorillibacterium sp.]
MHIHPMLIGAGLLIVQSVVPPVTGAAITQCHQSTATLPKSSTISYQSNALTLTCRQSARTAASDDGTLSPEEAKKEVGEVAQAAIIAIKNKDTKALQQLVHPAKGIRFTPYASVDLIKNVVLRPAQLKDIFHNPTVLEWGVYDGRGDPIQLTFNNYYNRFIFNRDFSNAERVGYNEIVQQGNSLSNIRQAYPNGVFVEYNFSKSPEGNEIGWSSLRLVFEKDKGAWALVGIIHDEWTI